MSVRMMAAAEGVLVRHSRRCPRYASKRTRPPIGVRCGCNPGYETWVWDQQRQQKVARVTCADLAAAHAHRRDQLRRLYGLYRKEKGRVDEAYGLLRKSELELDAALSELAPRARSFAREALDHLYRAEDVLGHLLIEIGL